MEKFHFMWKEKVQHLMLFLFVFFEKEITAYFGYKKYSSADFKSFWENIEQYKIKIKISINFKLKKREIHV